MNSISLLRDPLANQAWRPFAVCLAAYLGLHFTLRLFISGGLELDEAEQMVLGQSLAWGYGKQPPLYTWLQWLFFQTLGPGLLALTYTFVFLSARRVLGDARLATLAAFSLLLIPSFAWESLRDLTHSVLVSAAAFYVTLRVLRAGAALVIAGRAGQTLIAPHFGHYTRLDIPFAQLAAQMRGAMPVKHE